MAFRSMPIRNDLTENRHQEALGAYQQGFAISKRLTEQDKDNSGWQRDLIESGPAL